MSNENRNKFCLGPFAAVASFLAILGYFAIPMNGLVASGQYSVIPEVVPWSFGFFAFSTIVGLMCAVIFWLLGGRSRWQTIAFSGSQGVFAVLLVLIGMVGNRMASETQQVAAQVQPTSVSAKPSESIVIADVLWEHGRKEADLGNYGAAINAMTTSVKIHPSDERMSELLAIELLHPSDSD